MSTTTDNNRIQVLKVSDEESPFWGEILRQTWLGDSSRPWDVYAREQFTKFWDMRVVESRRTRTQIIMEGHTKQ